MAGLIARALAFLGFLGALIRGIDVSHWSGTINWVTVRANNIVQFVIAKCTEGLDFLDSQYFNNRDGCFTVKLPFAAYLFYRHNGNPVGQAQWFHSKVGAGVKVAINDVETTLAKMLGIKPGSDYKTWQRAIKSVEKQMKAKNVADWPLAKAEAIRAAQATLAEDVYTCCKWLKDQGYRVVIYSSPGFILSFLQDARLAEFELWIAHIGVSKPTIPAPWAQFGEWLVNTRVPLWQDTWTYVVDGVPEAAVDGNLWSPAAGDMYVWFGNGEPYSEPVDPVLPSYLVVLTTSGLNIRTGHGTGYASVGKLPSQVCLKPFEKWASGNDVWYRIGLSRWVAAKYAGQKLCEEVA
jgi:GH25 family lysozyme M1 (1,4-beta-N-acetylmuramidase)